MANLQIPGRAKDDIESSSTSERLSVYCVPCHNDGCMANLQVAGRANDDIESSSTSEQLSLYCVPCHSNGSDTVEAFGFCQNCQEHMCRSCFKNHRKYKPLAHHVLVDKEYMPKSMPGTTDSSTRKTLIPCPKHTDKFIDLFCPSHKKVLCYVCSNLDHKQCKTEYIPDNVASYLKMEGFKAQLQRIPALRERCNRITKSVNDKLETAVQNAKTTEEDFKIRKAMIIEVLEQHQKEINQITRDFQQQARQKADTVLTPCDEIRRKTLQIESKTAEEESDAKFINTMLSLAELDQYEKDINQLEEETIPTHIAFSADQSTSGMDELKDIVGTVTISSLSKITSNKVKVVETSLSADTVVEKKSIISVKTSEDKERCWITGMTSLSNSSIVIADCYNDSIKVIDTNSNKISQRVQLTSAPYDLTAIPNNKLAVTLRNDMSIQILTTNPQLKVRNKLSCKQNPNGIDHHQGKLVVSFPAPHHCVEVLLLTGEALQTVASGLHHPFYVAVSDDGAILVGEHYNNSVLKLNWTGNVLGTYKHPDLKSPRGMAVCGDDKIIVCSKGSNSVHLVSGTCSKVKTLLDETSDIFHPQYCLYDKQKNALYTSTSSRTNCDNFVQVFQLK